MWKNLKHLVKRLRMIVDICDNKTVANMKCLGIRRETVNPWERRAPLAPHHVSKLTESGVKVLIQSSNNRVYPTSDYERAGAIEREDLSEASLIIGVKEVPTDDLMPNKTYAFFSHTIKAQKNNMGILDTVLERNIRLIDYEKMVDVNNRRVVAFGKYAGYAGIINILHGLGRRLLAMGHSTPFLHIDLAHDYRDCGMAVKALKAAGNEIGQGLIPRSLAPMIFVFTGKGNVSKGAQELFQYLPHEYISVESLPEIAEFGRVDRLYACVVRKEDHLIRKNGGEFNAAEYNRSPHLYTSTFAYDVAPYASVIVNGISWAVNSPRLITSPEAKMLLSSQTRINGLDVSGCHTLHHRLLAISDISADPGGSIEFIKECTTIDEPFCIYDSDLNKIADSFHCDSGVLVCSISNLPAQLPMEATNFFGDLLFSYINDMLESDAGQPFEEYNVSPVVRNAVIASNGKLTPNFQYIAALRRQQQATTGEDMKKAMDDNMHPNYEPTNLQQLFHVMDMCGRA